MKIHFAVATAAALLSSANADVSPLADFAVDAAGRRCCPDDNSVETCKRKGLANCGRTRRQTGGSKRGRSARNSDANRAFKRSRDKARRDRSSRNINNCRRECEDNGSSRARCKRNKCPGEIIELFYATGGLSYLPEEEDFEYYLGPN